MSQIRFLIDESLPRSLVAGLRRRESSIDVWRVGQPNMPAFGASDAELLRFCEKSERTLVSLDRASIPGHVTEHLTAGGHTWGVLLVTRRCTFRGLLDELVLIWSASDSADWRDVLLYLPLPESL